MEELIKKTNIDPNHPIMRSLPIEAIVEKVKKIVEPDSVQYWTEVTPISKWRIAKLIFSKHDAYLLIEQTVSQDSYLTYFNYSII